MKLVHYSKDIVGSIYSVKQLSEDVSFRPKPVGLWVSDDACVPNWHSWCKSKSFFVDSLVNVHDVNLRAGKKILLLCNAGDIRDFTDQYGQGGYRVDWQRVAAQYQGIIITPYIWEMRLDMHACWYCPWDCAGGCIWDAEAVASIKLRQQRKSKVAPALLSGAAKECPTL